ncbi:MAG: hypothetical protein H6901_08245 [Rhodobacteraceae bacterium]|nr:hypothetical protein [Paracoccaceae bacterium]MCP5342190.1 hypothetical protein [Paracoccaceae bacterium]
MSKPRLAVVILFLLLFIAVMGGLPLLKGAFYLGKHEGDTMHLAELVLRMADGQWPHLDFMTPIGVLAIAPIAIFVKYGAGLGHAIFYSQILVAMVLLLPTLRVAQSRLTGIWPYFFGAAVMTLCLALVHGEAQSAVSISMHYNRWAWAISYIIIPLAVLTPADRPMPKLDGALVGLGMAGLVLIKVTYFVAFAPGVLLALLARRQIGMVVAALIAGLVVAAIVTLLAGPGFWLAYLGDLQTVSASDIRPQPGEEFAGVVAAPLYMGASLTLIATVIFLRQAGRKVEGLAMLALMPGFFYVAYQNYGNDPQWLYLLAMFAFVLRPTTMVKNGFGWNLRAALTTVGILALAFGAPSAINLVYSPWRHLAADTENTVPLLSALPVHDDVLTVESRIYRVNITRSEDRPGMIFASYRDRAKREDEAVLNGEELDECLLESGMAAWFEVVTADLEQAGYAGAHLMGTDLFSAYWLFGDFRPVKGAAPWYYGGLSGVENADYLVVPTCPMATNIRSGMLKSLTEGGWALREVRRTPLYILIEPSAP